ncbi:hypothetical protein LXL04_010175 [Taraxacum kok-saghyz]
MLCHPLSLFYEAITNFKSSTYGTGIESEEASGENLDLNIEVSPTYVGNVDMGEGKSLPIFRSCRRRKAATERENWSPKKRITSDRDKRSDRERERETRRKSKNGTPEERVAVGVAGNGKSQSTSEWPETRSPSRRMLETREKRLADVLERGIRFINVGPGMI